MSILMEKTVKVCSEGLLIAFKLLYIFCDVFVYFCVVLLG